MLSYALRRIAGLIPTLLVIITVSFGVVRLAPGGPFEQEQTLPLAVRANLERLYGLDQPLTVQYAHYLRGLLRGDFGPSLRQRDFTVAELRHRPAICARVRTVPALAAGRRLAARRAALSGAAGGDAGAAGGGVRGETHPRKSARGARRSLRAQRPGPGPGRIARAVASCPAPGPDAGRELPGSGGGVRDDGLARHRDSVWSA